MFGIEGCGKSSTLRRSSRTVLRLAVEVNFAGGKRPRAGLYQMHISWYFCPLEVWIQKVLSIAVVFLIFSRGGERFPLRFKNSPVSV